jgi:hypothetical protein
MGKSYQLYGKILVSISDSDTTIQLYSQQEIVYDGGLLNYSILELIQLHSIKNPLQLGLLGWEKSSFIQYRKKVPVMMKSFMRR